MVGDKDLIEFALDAQLTFNDGRNPLPDKKIVLFAASIYLYDIAHLFIQRGVENQFDYDETLQDYLEPVIDKMIKHGLHIVKAKKQKKLTKKEKIKAARQKNKMKKKNEHYESDIENDENQNPHVNIDLPVNALPVEFKQSDPMEDFFFPFEANQNEQETQENSEMTYFA